MIKNGGRILILAFLQNEEGNASKVYKAKIMMRIIHLNCVAKLTLRNMCWYKTITKF